MNSTKKKYILSIVMLVLAGIVWGASFAIVKDSLDYLTPLWQLANRLSIASIPSIIICILNYKKINRKLVVHTIILGCFFALALIFQNIGTNYSTASKTAFLTGTYVAFIPLIEILFLRRKLKKKRIIAAILCMIGTAVLTLQSRLVPQWGDIIVILCGLFYAVHILYIEKINEENTILMHAGQIVVAFVIAIILAFIVEPLPDIKIFTNPGCITGLLYCGIFELFLGFFFQMLGQKNTNPGLAGILLSMESVYGAVFAVFLLGEHMSIQMVIGCVIMVAAAMINGMEK